MNVSDFHGLLVATSVSVDCMNQLELESEQPSSKAAVNTNKCLIQVSLTVLEESSPAWRNSDNVARKALMQTLFDYFICEGHYGRRDCDTK
jgi:hypothetical protein